MATAGFILWALLALRSIRLARRSPRLTGDHEISVSDSELPHVLAVVPAHNEETGIEMVVRGILSQNWPEEKLSLVVVNDQSTDQTGEILLDLVERPEFALRLRVIQGKSRPQGWAGKTWAVEQGIESSPTQPWIWMVDSDMRLNRSILKIAYSKALDHKADLVSLTAGVDAETFAQKTTALAMIHLLWQFYPLPYVNDRRKKVALAHGAFLLISREMYQRIGTIAAFRHEIIEDIRLAQRVKAMGGQLAVHPAPELTKTHFYGSLRQILDGLRKNAFAGMDFASYKFWFGLIFGIFLCWIPLICLTGGLTGLILGWGNPAICIGIVLMGIYSWVFQAQSLWPIVVYLNLPRRFALSLPIGGTIYMYACWLSYWDYVRGRVVWRGRDFQVSDLSSQ